MILEAYRDNLNENGNYRRIMITNKSAEDLLNNDATREVICEFLGKISREKTVIFECDSQVFDSWSRDPENAEKITLKYKGGDEGEMQTFTPERFRE